MIDYLEEIRNADVSELTFRMNGKELRVVKATAVNGNRIELTLAENTREVKGIHPQWKIDRGSNKTQKQAIRDYLESGHSITPLEALEMFGCFRLGAQIFDLKAEGMAIETTIKKDENTGKRYAVYFLSPDKPKEK